MSSRHKTFHKRMAQPNRTAQRGTIRTATVFPAMMLGLTVITVLMGLRAFTLADGPAVVKIAPPPASDSLMVNAPKTAPASIRDPNQFFVGIVSGHRGYDPGAVCDDGLTEADINYAIAQEVVDLLNRRGIGADLLNEYDDRLTDYQADALVSIHSDSCNIPGASGFKVARVTDSVIPEAEDHLVACLNEKYQVETDLPQHPASITDNMTNYHAFNEINPFTPGAIIETGFMLDDRFMLQHRPKVVARGIAAGIVCFLEGVQ